MENQREAARIVFTDNRIRGLTCPPGRDRLYVYDSKTPGLALSVSPTGNRTFYICRRMRGRYRRIRLGRYGDLSIGEARKQAAAVGLEVATGADPAESRRTIRGKPTLGDLFRAYIAAAKLRKRTWAEDEKQFARYLGDWQNRKLSSIERMDIERLHGRIGEDSPYAANRLLALLSAMFNKASHRVGWTGGNVAKGIERFPERSRDRFLDADELRRFFDAIQAEPTAIWRDFFQVLLLSGARRANVLAMKWADVNLDRGLWRIPPDESKNAEPLLVVLTVTVVDVLKRRAETAGDGEFVFPSHGRTGHLAEPKAAWRRVCERAGLLDVRLHDLRRTLGSWQALLGGSLNVIGKSLGHKNLATTQVYARLQLDPVRQSVNAATEAMLTAAGQIEPDTE